MVKVLLVEDCAPIAGAVTRLLERHGIETQHVASAARALRSLQPPSLWDGFLLDVQLDEPFDGLDVLDVVLAVRPDVPRAMISGNLAPAVLNRAMRCGTSFICKPCGKDEIAVFAREVLCGPVGEPMLRAHVTSFGRRAMLSPTEQAILARLVVGETRESYLIATGISRKTLDAQVGAIVLKAKRIGFQIDDIKDLVSALLRGARITAR